MRIKTDYNPKPIPNRNMDWDAWDDDTLDIDSYMGHGATEREAIEDLKQHYDTFLAPDPETMEKWGDAIMEQVGEDRCRHGNLHGECSTCDFEGDLAYDAAREDRVFGRR